MITARLTPAILRAIRAASRRPAATLAVALAFVVGALFYVAGHFAMTTDTGELISAKTPWRQDGAAIEAAFPQLKDRSCRG
jgi:predicted RND superfamily exporter protein